MIYQLYGLYVKEKHYMLILLGRNEVGSLFESGLFFKGRIRIPFFSPSQRSDPEPGKILLDLEPWLKLLLFITFKEKVYQRSFNTLTPTWMFF